MMICKSVPGVMTIVCMTMLASGMAHATPTVSDVELVQDRGTRLVSISYRLPTEAAVVTLDIQTNDVSIGAANFANVRGDVNRLVPRTDGDESRLISWNPVELWPSNKFRHAELKAVLTAWSVTAPPDYVVYDLTQNVPANYYVSADLVPGGVTSETYKTTHLVLRRIHATGVPWRMGSPANESCHQANETLHAVTLSADYYMSIYPFTCGQYAALTGEALTSVPAYTARYPSNHARADLRACDMWKTTFDAIRGGDWPTGGRAGIAANSLTAKLRQRTGQDTFDLPTEAQWEFACRAGTRGGYSNDGPVSEANLLLLGWDTGYTYFEGETADQSAQPVGFKLSNAWGLYDMHGTILEVCLDWYQADLGSTPVIDPVGPDTGTVRVTRGGGMHGTKDSGYQTARSAWRGSKTPNSSLLTGFRFMTDAVAK